MLTPGELHALTAPDVLPHLPYLLALAFAAVLIRRWPEAHSEGIV